MGKMLCMDLGNTRTHWAVFEERDILSSGIALPAKEELQGIEAAIISQVGSQDLESLQEELGISVKVLKHNTPLPIKLKYKGVESLGTDRIAAAVATHARFPQQAAMSIDLGTCITYDVVNEKGEYLGGAISPGLAMRTKAMNQFTASLPEVEIEFPPEFIGNTTQHSLQSGVMHAVQYEIEGMIAAVEKKFDDIQVILTGGDAFRLVKVIKNHIFADSNLVLKGLNEILLYNRG